MNRKQKQNEQKPKGENKKCCMECGSSSGIELDWYTTQD